MQQMPPPSGNLFPNTPQQQSAPRFASNAQQSSQSYEPQTRMQQTGSIPVLQTPRYATGQLQALHGTIPVQQMPPMSAMPVAPAYQAQQAASQQTMQQAASQQPAPQQTTQQPASQQGTPLMVYTVQGTPVAVNAEEMKRALAELEAKSGKKQTVQQKQEGKQKQSGKFVMKFSIAWMIFGVIGVISVVLFLLEWAAIPVLKLLHDLLAGGGV